MTEMNVNTTSKIIIPKKPWDEEKRKEILETLNSISDDDIQNALKEEERLKRRKSIIEQEEKEKLQKEQAEEEKKPNISPELENAREKWKKNMMLDKKTKNKIIQAVENIPLEESFDSDGNKIISFSLWWKLYHILGVDLGKFSDDKYNCEYILDWVRKKVVTLWWIRWDNLKKWKDKKLAKYVKNQEQKWFNIPTRDLMVKILEDLWKDAGLNRESNQTAMRMYLMGMEWSYRLTMYDAISRSHIVCDYKYDHIRGLNHSYFDSSAYELFLISPEENIEILWNLSEKLNLK